MTALEARAHAEAHAARTERQKQVERNRAYLEYRPRIDAAITERAAKGYTDAITGRPRDIAAAELLEIRLRKRGYSVRWMRDGPDFYIEWGEGYQ